MITNVFYFLSHPAIPTVSELSSLVEFYALILSIITAIGATKKIARLWRTRNLRKLWGIKDGDYVLVVCSELDEPEARQNVERREFIYNLKYGDVDAYFEVIVTLLRLFPKIKLRILSSGEAKTVRMDLAQHVILIGGVDYNAITESVVERKVTQFGYKSPDLDEKSIANPREIVIYETVSGKEYCEQTNEKDYGYFERIRNPHNPKNNIILIGGCHTIGVTAAAKAFSMAESEHGEIPDNVLENARLLAGRISRRSEFAVLIKADRIGQTINTPIIVAQDIMLRRK